MAGKPTPFCEHLGVRYEVPDDGGPPEVVLDLAPHLTTRRGVLHGGVSASLLDAALGAAVVAAMREEEWCATMSLNVQYIRPGRGEQVRGRGRVIKRGKRVAYASGELVDARGEVIATAQGVWTIWPAHPDGK